MRNERVVIEWYGYSAVQYGTVAVRYGYSMVQLQYSAVQHGTATVRYSCSAVRYDYSLVNESRLRATKSPIYEFQVVIEALSLLRDKQRTDAIQA